MTKPTEPQIPEGLLARCLSTIPDTATYRPAAPRLTPDLGSRMRLRWLGAAAAVPVIMVAAILPIRQWLAAREQAASLSKGTSAQNNFLVEAAQKKGFVRVQSWRVAFNTNFETLALVPSRAPKKYTMLVMHRDKGIYEAQVTDDYKTLLKPDANKNEWQVRIPNQEMLDPWDVAFFNSSLKLPEGKIYHWDGKSVSVKIVDRKSWQENYNREFDWAIAETLSPESSHKSWNIKKTKVSAGTWLGKPATVVEYALDNTMKPTKKRVVFLYRIQFFISPTSSFVLGRRRYIKAKDIKQTGTNKEILESESDYSYEPTADDLRHLDLQNFLNEVK